MGIVTHRMVPDPSMTDSEYYHQRSLKPGNPNVGKVMAQENTTTRIGGLAYIKHRLNHHEKAAERFKSDYEHLYGAGNPAIDLSRVRVDTTIMTHDSGMTKRIDRGRELGKAMDALGPEWRDLVIAVIVLGIPIKDVADGEHWRTRKKTTGELLMALDNLAVRWGYVTRNAVGT